MMLASAWATPWMISAAAFISNRPMLDGPVMLSSTPRAPSIADSSSGLEIAALAAATARSSPLAWPMPISAEPACDSTIFTSAKSVLISPGVVIRLVMPDTPWSSTSSAILNALSTLVFSLATVSRRSLGMTISVSTFSLSRCTPVSACTARRRPSKENGRVTTPTVSAPRPREISAITGAPPVPVPPPSPAVMNTMSAPFTISSISSWCASAADRPTSGSLPAPRPRVSRARCRA